MNSETRLSFCVEVEVSVCLFVWL